MKQIGFLVGGARALIEALLSGLGDNGTLMMPSYTGDISDPAEWQFPEIPETQIGDARKYLCLYDPLRSPSRGMGVAAEYFRTYPNVVRSMHPQSSFVAHGPSAGAIMDGHDLAYRFGVNSPLGRLCLADGYAVLLGAPYRTVSLFHLVRSFLVNNDFVIKRYPMQGEAGLDWVEVDDFAYKTDWFEDGLEYLLRQNVAWKAKFGKCNAVIMPARESVCELVCWLGGDVKKAKNLLFKSG